MALQSRTRRRADTAEARHLEPKSIAMRFLTLRVTYLWTVVRDRSNLGVGVNCDSSDSDNFQEFAIEKEFSENYGHGETEFCKFDSEIHLRIPELPKRQRRCSGIPQSALHLKLESRNSSSKTGARSSNECRHHQLHSENCV